jgi:hypothetical protein
MRTSTKWSRGWSGADGPMIWNMLRSFAGSKRSRRVNEGLSLESYLETRVQNTKSRRGFIGAA